MPKLLLFAPCERVIIGEGDGHASLISLMQRTSVHGPDEPAKDAVAPIRWYAFALWQKIETDKDEQNLEQKIVLINPKGEPTLEVVTAFPFKTKLHRVVNTMFGFPIAISGQYELKISIREAGTEQWEERASYPLEVIHTSTPASGANLAAVFHEKKQ